MGILYKSLPGFLGEQNRRRLFDYVLANESRFEPTKVGAKENGRVDEKVRISSVLFDLGDMQSLLEEKVLEAVPYLVGELGMPLFQPSEVESEIVVHGDGAFYTRHIDTFTGTSRTPEGQDRMLTLVYYFYGEPKSFTGGELTLYPLPGMAQTGLGKGMDIVPEQDTAVAFSSWLPHEVRKTICPSGRFRDSRFSINFWVLRDKA